MVSEERLEDLRVVVRHDQTHKLAIPWIDRSDHVLPDMPAVIGLGGTGVSERLEIRRQRPHAVLHSGFCREARGIGMGIRRAESCS